MSSPFCQALQEVLKHHHQQKYEDRKAKVRERVEAARAKKEEQEKKAAAKEKRKLDREKKRKKEVWTITALIFPNHTEHKHSIVIQFVLYSYNFIPVIYGNE